MGDYQIRLYRPGDETAINDGYNEIFNQNRSLETWRWKFRAAENKHLIMVALNAAGELVSHYGFILEDVMIDGEHHLAGQAADVYRLNREDTGHQFIFADTGKAAIKEIEDNQLAAFGFGFPGVRSMRIGLLRMKYSEPRDVTYLTREPASPHDAEPKSRWSKFMALFRQPDRQPAYEVRSSHDVETMDDLWARSAWRYPVAVIRDGGRIQRRYDRHPTNTYIHLSLWKEGIVHAWGALRQAGDTLQWVDLLWDGTDPNALRALDRAVRDTAKQVGAAKLEMWLSNDSEVKAILESAGWREVPNPLELKMTARVFKPGLTLDDILPRLYITMSDGDLV